MKRNSNHRGSISSQFAITMSLLAKASRAAYYEDKALNAEHNLNKTTITLAQVQDEKRRLQTRVQQLERVQSDMSMARERLRKHRHAIAEAIRELHEVASLHDATAKKEDKIFAHEYQWAGVVDVMWECHLLPLVELQGKRELGNKDYSFCAICNDPSSDLHFLPYSPTGGGRGKPENSYHCDKDHPRKGIYHELVSRRDSDRKHRPAIIENTKREFRKLLIKHGVIDS